MIRVVVRGPVEEVANQFAGHVAQLLTAGLEAVQANARVLGPAPAPFSKLRSLYRFQIQIQGPDGQKLRQVARQVSTTLTPPDKVQWIVDVDPLDML